MLFYVRSITYHWCEDFFLHPAAEMKISKSPFRLQIAAARERIFLPMRFLRKTSRLCFFIGITLT